MTDSYDQEKILDYVEGELTPDAEHAFKLTMLKDAKLRRLVEQMIADRQALRQLPVEPVPLSLVEQVDQYLERDMLIGPAGAGAPGQASLAPGFRGLKVASWLALAAVLMLGVGLFVFQADWSEPTEPGGLVAMGDSEGATPDPDLEGKGADAELTRGSTPDAATSAVGDAVSAKPGPAADTAPKITELASTDEETTASPTLGPFVLDSVKEPEAVSIDDVLAGVEAPAAPMIAFVTPLKDDRDGGRRLALRTDLAPPSFLDEMAPQPGQGAAGANRKVRIPGSRDDDMSVADATSGQPTVPTEVRADGAATGAAIAQMARASGTDSAGDAIAPSGLHKDPLRRSTTQAGALQLAGGLEAEARDVAATEPLPQPQGNAHQEVAALPALEADLPAPPLGIDEISADVAAPPVPGVTVEIFSRNTGRSLIQIRRWARTHKARAPRLVARARESARAKEAREKIHGGTDWRGPAKGGPSPGAPGATPGGSRPARVASERHWTLQIKAGQLKELVADLRAVKSQTVNLQPVLVASETSAKVGRDTATGRGAGRAAIRPRSGGSALSPVQPIDPLLLPVPDPAAPMQVTVIIRKLSPPKATPADNAAGEAGQKPRPETPQR